MSRTVRLLLGPAGSGKTFNCLREIREALRSSPTGLPLLLVTPKHTTYQLERQLLSDADIPGYTRLHILSFERLADFIFKQLRKAPPKLLDEQGRLMVLRSLLTKNRPKLTLYRASSRLTGFAPELSRGLRELQHRMIRPEQLFQLAEQLQEREGLALKLRDLGTLLESYLDWLKTHDLQDADCLLSAATFAIEEAAGIQLSVSEQPQQLLPGLASLEAPAARELLIEHLWLDGFVELSPQELDLLATLIPHCRGSTWTFCLDRLDSNKLSWLSFWSPVRDTFETCKKRLQALPNVGLMIEVLERASNKGRFADNSALQHLEQFWSERRAYLSPEHELAGYDPKATKIRQTLRIAACTDAESEVILAAREILRHVKAGGRFRDVSLLVRNLDDYHQELERVFSRYEIPYFLDRRQSVSHHPLAELTRGALRTAAFQWQHEDWFGALKSGLLSAGDEEIDRLENEALARGWKGKTWSEPLTIADEPELSEWLANIKSRLVPPFHRLELDLAVRQHRPTGKELGEALRRFWLALGLEEKLDLWTVTMRGGSRLPSSVHATVWEQINAWLRSVELAFANESLPLREWLPILETALSNFTVGVIPPALDQVLIGTIERSRDPDIKLALTLGMNETVFPAKPQPAGLLTDADLVELERMDLRLGSTARRQLAREQFLAYIACTRPRARLVLTYALQDSEGNPLNPSPFISEIRQLFPTLGIETVPGTADWRESEHPCELVVPVLQALHTLNEQHKTIGGKTSNLVPPGWESLVRLPVIAPMVEKLQHSRAVNLEESISPALAARLYGPVLRTSVSRMEQFAKCPFKFFVHSGLRAEERQLFELDPKEKGSFQHDVLAFFHGELRKEGKRWRDITPRQARERIDRIVRGLMTSYREGLLQASQQSRFTARILGESLQDCVETLVGWANQYQFDPVAVELSFGEDEHSPAWTVELGDEKKLAFRGRIDRVDICRDSHAKDRPALCVVIDYKSSEKQLDPVFLAHGLQLQLLAYLNVLANWPKPEDLFGTASMAPVGAFFVNLRGKYERANNREDAMSGIDLARKQAYQHTGRFDVSILRKLDARPQVERGDQFKYRLTRTGEVYSNSREALSPDDFQALLDTVQANAKRMGVDIFAGVTRVAPFRKGATTACDQCSYQAICRIDPWTHPFRVLSAPPATNSKKKATRCRAALNPNL